MTALKIIFGLLLVANMLWALHALRVVRRPLPHPRSPQWSSQ